MGGLAVPALIHPKDVRETFVGASGPGGQNVNKVATCVQLLHRPTGLTVKCQTHRTQALNRQEAWRLLGELLSGRVRSEKASLRQAREKLRRQNRRRSAAAKEIMLQHKKKRSLIKRRRKGAGSDD